MDYKLTIKEAVALAENLSKDKDLKPGEFINLVIAIINDPDQVTELW